MPRLKPDPESPSPSEFKPIYFFSVLLDEYDFDLDPDVKKTNLEDILEDPQWKEIELPSPSSEMEDKHTGKVYKKGERIAIVSNKEGDKQIQKGSLVLLHKDAISREGKVL